MHPTTMRHAVSSLALALTCLTTAAQAANELPQLNADATRTSVSGLSSGAFMTVQYGVAFSSSVMGLGVIAGGPYNCAYVNFGGVQSCMEGNPSGRFSWLAAQGFASLGQIDPAEGISKLKVYVFGGTKDEVVYPSVVASTRDFFQAAGVKPENLNYVGEMPAGHAFISASFDEANACDTNGKPYIDRCTNGSNKQTYDQPKEILQHIYGPLKPAADTLSASVQPFNQRAFAGSETSMDAVGFVYIPQDCAKDASGCAVHVVFHGCKQGAQRVGNKVYESVGYNRWADTNRLIVLYPQAVSSAAVPYNPNGCWDWWGYTGLNFQVRNGAQLAAVKSMVDRLTTVK